MTIGTTIEVGDVITPTLCDDAEPMYGPEDWHVEGDMFIVRSINGDIIEGALTLDCEWAAKTPTTMSIFFDAPTIVHHHEGHACGNPAHIDHDGYIGYHREA